MLDKRNYIRSKENFFVWILKGDIDKKLKRVTGSVAIVETFFINGTKCEETTRFTKFGRTKIEIPWEELENATFYGTSQSN